jgi:hypothetical protein
VPVEGGLHGEVVLEHLRRVQRASIQLIHGTSALESPERLSSPLSYALVRGPMTLRAAHALIPCPCPGENVQLHHPLGKVPVAHAVWQHWIHVVRLPHALMIIRLIGGQGAGGARSLGHLEEDERADQGGLDLLPPQPKFFPLYVSRLLDLHVLVSVLIRALILVVVLVLLAVLVLQPAPVSRIACSLSH